MMAIVALGAAAIAGRFVFFGKETELHEEVPSVSALVIH